MRWGRKRRIKRLPELQLDLAASHNLWQQVIQEIGDGASPEMRRAAEELQEASREQLDACGRFIEELEESAIADPEFDDWFDEVRPLAKWSLERAERNLAELRSL